jgi:hypothetical protein
MSILGINWETEHNGSYIVLDKSINEQILIISTWRTICRRLSEVQEKKYKWEMYLDGRDQI